MSESAEESQRSEAQRSDSGRRDRSEHVDRHVASAVKKMVRDLQDLAVAAEAEAVGQLLAATARVDSETTQSGILATLLEEGQRFASRTAFFLTRPGEIRGWAGRGFPAVEQAHLDYQDGSVWARLASQAGAINLSDEDCAAVCRSLSAPVGGPGVLIPFILRGQLGGIVYADRLEDEGPLAISSLQLLTHSAAQTVETAALRGGGSSPTLRMGAEASGQESPISLWQAPEGEAASAGSAVASTAVAAVAGAAALAETVAPAPVVEEAVPAPVVEEAAPAPVVEEAAPAPDSESEASTAGDEMPAEPEEVAEAASEEAADVEAAELEEVELEEVDPEEGNIEAVDLEEDEAEAVDLAGVDSEDSEAIDFEMVTTEVEEDIEAADDIQAELEPEPELEDTSDLWAVEEEVEEEEEATFVGPALVEEPVVEQSPAMVPPEVGQETVRLDIAALQGQMPGIPADPATEAETAQLPQWNAGGATPAEPASPEFELEAEEEPAAPVVELEPELSEPVTTPMAKPDFSEDATIINPPREQSPMAGGYVPPAQAPSEVVPPSEVPPSSEVAPPSEVTPPPSSGFAAPPPKTDAAGTTQVVPPTDIQGPGSAFGAMSDNDAIAEGEEALHEEARRLARLLVSEIKLYNEEIIEEGRRSGNIYDRLKDDIDRSRQMYEERIDPRLVDSGRDYFRLELVQRLAGGDEKLLGY